MGSLCGPPPPSGFAHVPTLPAEQGRRPMPSDLAPPLRVMAQQERHPARKIEAELVSVLVADGDGFQTRPVESVAVDLEGLVVEGLRGERHRGWSRAADARTPWYPRG